MKRIKNREDRVAHLLRIYPKCLVCGMKFEEQPMIAMVRMLYPQYRGWSARDIHQALRVEVHHRMPDSDVNVARYPLFIHSDYNEMPLHAKCHAENKFFMQIGDFEAGVLELELREESCKK